MRLIQLLLLVFIVLFCFEKVFASDSKEKLNLSELDLELSTVKQEFILLEPITLTVTLRNKFGQPIMPENKPEISSQDVQMLFFPSSQKKVRLTPLSDSISSTLSSKEISTAEKELSYHLIPGRGKNCSTPGEYKMQLIIKNGKEKLLSNLLTIKIVEPLGIDKEVYNELKAFPGFDTLVGISGISEDINLSDKLYKIATSFPSSVYSNFIIFDLAEMHFSLGNYTSATSYLEQVLTSDKNFPFLDIILNHLKEINLTTGDIPKAEYYANESGETEFRKDMIMYF